MQPLVHLRLERNAPGASQHQSLYRDLSERIAGEVRFDDGARALYATDGSNYRQLPVGLVVPRNADDVVRTVAVCRAHGVPLLSRGGGTSLAGQCCNHAVVMDMSKYVNWEPQIDVSRRLARVAPGTVLDVLRAAAKPHGLTFGPDPATHNHCTLGGMIGNNSCGVHAVQSEFYGPGSRTSDNVHSLEVLTYRGTRMRVGATSDAEYREILAQGGHRAEIYRALRGLRDRYADEIRARFPDIPRRVSGYNLPALLPENGFHVAQALVGSEATCVTVLEAELKLIDLLPARSLLVLGYPSVFEAGDHVAELRQFKPVGLEGFDQLLVDFTREQHLNDVGLERLPEGHGWLLAEFGGRTQEEADQRAREAKRHLEGSKQPAHMVLLTDPHKQELIWKVREAGLGVTAHPPGQPMTLPGWEDSAVPPSKVGPYLRELRALMQRFGYKASLYGHFGQGCVHCSIPFDLHDERGVHDFAAFTREAAEIVVRHGGSLSGEHGDGQARGDLLELMYGPHLVQAFREFKAIWDPDNLMNPGKVVTPHGRTDDLRVGPATHLWRPSTYFKFPDDDSDFSQATQRCVGVGKCRREGGGTMCPSYMVTGEEMHSTRGRAHLLFEMLEGDALQHGWANEGVKEALDLCLACKGCKSECPVSVDMATYKAEFLAHYYEHHARPRQAYAFGWIDRSARLASHVPRLANAVTHMVGLQRVAKFLGGIANERTIPRFASRSFREWFAHEQGKLAAGGERVVLWPDTFNNYFKPETLIAATKVLSRAGIQVTIPSQHLCCGRALYDYGMLGQARSYWQRTLRALRDEIDAGTPIVGLEPSCVAAFRDELINLYPDDEGARKLSKQVLTFGEYLERRKIALPHLEGKALYHGHCHQKAVLGGVDGEVELLEKAGLSVEVPDSGCCGMAGAFGYEKDKYEVSMAAAERVLLPKVREAAADTLLIADGFSCREQIEQSTSRQALHFAEVLERAFSEPDPGEWERAQDGGPALSARSNGTRVARALTIRARYAWSWFVRCARHLMEVTTMRSAWLGPRGEQNHVGSESRGDRSGSGRS